ncbi:MAG TPA: hypothetical protein VL490_04345 [Mucilaginibacter sp.]|jgi:hypothetical protein|nr:hypothetical protein [Mucilaginibacter sp.]
MNLALNFIIWMFCIRYCAYQGSKRVIGSLSGAVIGALFTLFGILLVRWSRRLLDEEPVR